MSEVRPVRMRGHEAERWPEPARARVENRPVTVTSAPEVGAAGPSTARHEQTPLSGAKAVAATSKRRNCGSPPVAVGLRERRRTSEDCRGQPKGRGPPPVAGAPRGAASRSPAPSVEPASSTSSVAAQFASSGAIHRHRHRHRPCLHGEHGSRNEAHEACQRQRAGVERRRVSSTAALAISATVNAGHARPVGRALGASPPPI